MKALVSSYITIVTFNENTDCIIRHRDINPNNIMVNADGVAFIIDFGQSKKYSIDGIMESTRTKLRGTGEYRPGFASTTDKDGNKKVISKTKNNCYNLNEEVI
ncbi:hypothetical protein TVAG_306250 [Trichomonas vaginalis G3]|uniref:Protein kinase domain-containing protein n=1 Tax=Trichomonas vaginalis (strain ATCC PRA-98 / G3) TaxID=412133 RepID=A2DNB6_TRIV3|nr:protein kinase-like (PK-like) family [Trichomonas vaginalis G3]EAY18104.1 hypothetical protein TVAG_306250 [Trichomonas vaginalis G3]KAI5492381.1 protein kinase-like (PK-like) family [Trichomonas vaginalis G3]|eukprot:XP_001579090.1 hypothetical protein [Trichomonas vaginalis G3]